MSQNDKTCAVCHQAEEGCYSICPMQDPYGGSQSREEVDFVPDQNQSGFDAGDDAQYRDE